MSKTMFREDGSIVYACGPDDIDYLGEHLDDFEGSLEDDYCPICRTELNVVFGCPFRNEPDHQLVRETK